MFYSATVHWAKAYIAICRHRHKFYDLNYQLPQLAYFFEVIDSGTSFLRIKSVKKYLLTPVLQSKLLAGLLNAMAES